MKHSIVRWINVDLEDLITVKVEYNSYEGTPEQWYYAKYIDTYCFESMLW